MFGGYDCCIADVRHLDSGMHVRIYYTLIRHSQEFHANILLIKQIGRNWPFSLKGSLRLRIGFQSGHLHSCQDVLLGLLWLNALVHMVLAERKRREMSLKTSFVNVVTIWMLSHG